MTHSRPNEFIPPPECPVFEPSWEEFADPFGFINKIRPIAENTGICKIRPPPGWQPPFACDVDRLHFTPRIQRLNELEAQTRVKLNFLDQIAKFWELQGCTLKIPHVERKTLDLYVLYKLVKEEGGFDVVCKERRWTQIALRMGFAPGKAVGSHLRAHYERILYPYYLFQTGANLMNSQKPTLTNDTKDKEYKPHDLPQRQSVQPVETCTIARRAKRTKGRCFKSEPGEVCENKPNLRRRMGSYVAKPESVMTIPVQVKEEPIEQQVEGEKSKVEQYMCLVCGGGGDEDRLLLCDGCDDSYHTFCLIPPLHDVPKGDWRCPKCLAQECGKPQVAFGFEQASRDYTLRTFGDMADSFKSDYFNMPVHMVPTELVEKEFWRLVSTIEEDVTVEYGADIASKDFGSGFPVKNGTFKVSPEEEDYLSSGWNLNNMPVLDASVLTHVTADICGMKLPWLYVGMCFSSFCWHIEDHWSYSINYLHWGEPKTWYGAPGYAAEQLENVMKNLAPELFESQPDLLHQLVTIMNPNVLMEHGVPIYRTNQCAGEFVITFPRSYHSGFNQGFNFAEAVNFCTADWMPLGRQCVEHYRSLNRYCVFSHDEMTCNIAAKADSLELELASAVQKDMCAMILEEKMLRERAYKLGVWHSQQVDYDLLADEERQCAKCRTTCYLSAITCPCSPDQLVCLHHIEDLCSCPARSYTLNYKFTLAELKPLFQALTARAESYEDWASKVNKILKADHDNKSDLEELRSLIVEAEKKTYPETDLLSHLRQLTVEELRSFVNQLYDLPCTIRQAPFLKALLNRVEQFQQQSTDLLAEDMPGSSALQALLDEGAGLDVELPQLAVLRQRLEQARWVEAVQEASDQPADLSLDCMRRLIDQGVGLAPHASIQEVDSIPAYLPSCIQLKDCVSRAREWIMEADALQAGGRIPGLAALTELVARARGIPVMLEPLTRLESLVSEFQSSPSSVAPTVCLCHTVPAGPMLQCELCRDAYHSGCVPGFKDIQTGLPWLCPLCKRSEKPPLDKVLPLLASLQRIRVRLPEGDALRYVIERTVRWQHKVQQVLPIQHPNGKARNISGIASSQTLVGSNSSFYMLQPCIPLNELSAELEDLLVEGLLQQVTLPELQPLYSSLLNRFLPSQNSLQSSEHDHQYHIAQDRSPPHRSPPHSKGQDAVPETKKEPEKLEKNSKRRLEKENMEGQQRDKIKKPKKKKPKMNKERRREEKQTTSPSNSLSDLSYSDDSEEDWSVCSAKQCQQPEGNEVNWVQCDGSCNQWFHQICVGVSAEQAENEDYICSRPQRALARCASFRRVPGHLSVSLGKTGENMAGMNASGPGPVSTLDQVDKGLKETLIDALNAILSPVQEVRAAAEERIKVLEVTEEFGVHLAELTVDPHGALAIRQLASVILKQYVETHWCAQSEKYRPPETTEWAKAAIRELLPSGLREAISKVRSSVAYALSAIAHWDWPEAWPGLFKLLMDMLASGDVNAVHGAMRVLTEFTREVTDVQMPDVAPVILPQMYKIFTMAEVYSIRTRSRAVEIFTTCANLICAIDEVAKGAANTLIFPVVQQFTEAFIQALQIPDGPTSDSGLKMEVLKAVTALVKNFPKPMVSSMQQILPIVNYTEEVDDPVDSDGEVLGFENLVFSIFEFVHTLLENKKFKSTVKKALPELIYYIILYMQITEDQIKVWTANPQQFVEDEDDDTFSYSVRISAQDLLLAVAAEFQNESAAALAAAATRHLQEGEQAKNTGIKTIITENVKNGRVQFDMHGFLANVILADLNLPAASPFLLGRALWAASRFTAAMSPELIQQFLQATVSGLHESQPPSVRISAVRAIWGILEGLVQLAAQFSSEVLTLVMETLCIVCTVDPAFTTSAENKICPLTIAIFLKYSNDPVVASLAQDIFKELAQIEACQGPMQMRLIPTLVSIMQAPPDKIPSGLCATSIDILTTVVRNTKPPLSDMLVCQAFPAVAQCTLRTDDNTTMQNGGECLRAYVSVALEQIAQWQDEQGHSGLWYVMQVVSQLLDPRTSEFTAAFVGRLVSTLIARAGSQLADQLDQILRAILSKMQQAETLSVMQSLIMVFAHLVHSQLEPLLEFLCSLPGPTGKPALEFVMAEWMSRQHLFYGQYEGKVR
ncbi:Lysine-specific demethylase 5B [Labeo rohita]|uniref:[histone H3]-trimethyl-L-lysine(4) demethylase n=3 Tax=Labeonini TaxID=2743697 RepID=A0ABQ8M8K1_LABRO|nr:Lysine-specific demethylase 5B [Labeo rohita]